MEEENRIEETEEQTEEVKPEVKVQEKPQVVEKPVVEKKKSNKKAIIIAILITAAVILGCYYAYQYELGRNQMYYNTGYSNGLLYPENSGNIAYTNNGTLAEMPLAEACNNILQRQLNQQGGQ